MHTSAFLACSLDGYIARADGSVDWLNTATDEASKDEDYGYANYITRIDVIVMGHNSFRSVLGFGDWPYALPVVVLSRQQVDIPARLSSSVSTSSLAPAELLQALERQGHQRAYVDGGLTVHGFLQAGLLNEITITRLPVVLGSGIPLFHELAEDIQLQHMSTRSYPSGFVQSHYRLA